MTDQVKVEESHGIVVPGEQLKYSDAEKRAIAGGWVPLDEWTAQGKAPEDHRSAREFNDRGDLLKRIQDQNKYIKGMQESFETLRQHNARTYEAAYKKAMEDLNDKHRKAVEDGDVHKAQAAVRAINEENARFAQVRAANQQAAQQPILSPELEEWKASNPWYTEDADLAQVADGFAFAYVKSKGGQVQPQEVLAHVSKKMEKYVDPSDILAEPAPQPRRTSPDPVGGGRGAPKPSGTVAGIRKGDLSDEESKAMKDFVKWGLGSETDYLKQLKEVRG